MDTKQLNIELYDKRQKCTTTLCVEQLSENRFRMTDNDIFNCRLTIGTEFETRINNNGKHEIVRITKESAFVTRRFMLTSEFKESEYRLLGDEIAKQGGHWQVDFGSIATINLPKESKLDLDEIFEFFKFKPQEITE